MDGRRMMWVAWAAAAAIFIVLMLVMPRCPPSRRTRTTTTSPTNALFLGIPNTLNVISNIPFFFVGVAGLILCHYKNYFRLKC